MPRALSCNENGGIGWCNLGNLLAQLTNRGARPITRFARIFADPAALNRLKSIVPPRMFCAHVGDGRCKVRQQQA